MRSSDFACFGSLSISATAEDSCFSASSSTRWRAARSGGPGGFGPLLGLLGELVEIAQGLLDVLFRERGIGVLHGFGDVLEIPAVHGWLAVFLTDLLGGVFDQLLQIARRRSALVGCQALPA